MDFHVQIAGLKKSEKYGEKAREIWPSEGHYVGPGKCLVRA